MREQVYKASAGRYLGCPHDSSASSLVPFVQSTCRFKFESYPQVPAPIDPNIHMSCHAMHATVYTQNRQLAPLGNHAPFLFTRPPYMKDKSEKKQDTPYTFSDCASCLKSIHRDVQQARPCSALSEKGTCLISKRNIDSSQRGASSTSQATVHFPKDTTPLGNQSTSHIGSMYRTTTFLLTHIQTHSNCTKSYDLTQSLLGNIPSYSIIRTNLFFFSLTL